MLKETIIPESFKEDNRDYIGLWDSPHLDFEKRIKACELRETYIDNFGYCAVSMDWIRQLKGTIIKDGKCIEVCAGTGYLTKGLRNAGIEVMSCDNESWWTHFNNIRYIDDMVNADACEFILNNKEYADFVIMSWPDYDAPLAHDVLKTLLDIRNETGKIIPLIYVGEHWGGCTGADDFFELIDETDGLEMKLVDCDYIGWEPQVHDRVYIIK